MKGLFIPNKVTFGTVLSGTSEEETSMKKERVRRKGGGLFESIRPHETIFQRYGSGAKSVF
jgi:hypothetical protein